MNPHPSDAEIEDAAIAWITEREDGLTAERAREFAQWLRSDSRHVSAVARLEQTMGLLQEMPAFRSELNTEFDRTAPIVPFATGDVAPAPRPRPRRTRWLAWSGLAAALALGALVLWRSPLRSSADYYTTTVAGYERAILTDGSTVELNSSSALRVHFSATGREVNMETGEAHFHVSPDAARPFVVTAGDFFVRAVGTSFNVRLAPDGTVEVIVTEGKVQVGRRALEGQDPTETPMIVGGERLILPKQTPPSSAQKVSPETLRSALAWRESMAEFSDAPLTEVISRFNARNSLKIRVEDNELARRLVGGTFALDQAEAFVRLLERDGEIVGERRGDNEIVLRRAR